MTEKTSSYPQSWYPILKSKDISKNSKMIINAFEEDWLLFRGSDNKVGFIKRYCSHMGSDLFNGDIVDDAIQCPLHGWKFNNNGICLKNKPENEIGDGNVNGRNLKSLECKELYGLIFVFLGDRTTFDIPIPPNMPEVTAGGCYLFRLHANFHVPCLNTFDVQHYKRIHHREVLGSPIINSIDPNHLSIEMKTAILPINLFDRFMKWFMKKNAIIKIDCWGGSMLLMNNNVTDYGVVISMLPVGKDESVMFIVPVKNKSFKNNVFVNLYDKFTLYIALKMMQGFFKADVSVLHGMKAFEGCLMDGIDDVVKQYWSFFKKLPRHSLF